jgi:hypothetical protein
VEPSSKDARAGVTFDMSRYLRREIRKIRNVDIVAERCYEAAIVFRPFMHIGGVDEIQPIELPFDVDALSETRLESSARGAL